MREIGIYIHIPFCKSKCLYCDFNSFCNKDTYIKDYVKSLKTEIQNRSNSNFCIKTIFIGGGTPSYIDSQYIDEILTTIDINYNVDDDVEISIEMNPGTVDEKKMEDYFDIGINRISIGLQTSNNMLLKKIGRIHTYSEYEETVEIAKRVGFRNINTDVMIGLPGQTIYHVEDTINKLLEKNLQHISVYSLIVEPDTPMEKLVDSNKYILPDDEIERYMYWYAKRKLEENGFIHYEISNFARPEYRCKHNLDCWNQKEYLGFGISAASYENGVRFVNTDSIDEYISNIENHIGYKNIHIEEKQDVTSMMNEYMILGLRKIAGVDIPSFKEKFKQDPLTIYFEKLMNLREKGLIICTNDNIRLTKKGLDLANQVWEEFL